MHNLEQSSHPFWRNRANFCSSQNSRKIALAALDNLEAGCHSLSQKVKEDGDGAKEVIHA